MYILLFYFCILYQKRKRCRRTKWNENKTFICVYACVCVFDIGVSMLWKLWTMFMKLENIERLPTSNNNNNNN